MVVVVVDVGIGVGVDIHTQLARARASEPHVLVVLMEAPMEQLVSPVMAPGKLAARSTEVKAPARDAIQLPEAVRAVATEASVVMGWSTTVVLVAATVEAVVVVAVLVVVLVMDRVTYRRKAR